MATTCTVARRRMFTVAQSVCLLAVTAMMFGGYPATRAVTVASTSSSANLVHIALFGSLCAVVSAAMATRMRNAIALAVWYAAMSYIASGFTEPIRSASWLAAALACIVLAGRTRRERRALQGALQRNVRRAEAQSAQAERAAQFQVQFLADFSHELRTPLNGVIGATELLQSKELPVQAHRLVAMQRQSAEHLLTLVTEMLDYARLTVGKMPLMKEAYDIREAAADVTEMYAALAQAQAVELVSIVDNDVPRLLYGDVVRVRQILCNLVVNALRHTSAGAVEIHARPVRHALELEVRDTGTGISASAMANLFQAYNSEVGDPLRRARATGLGLAICRNLAEIMGGEISASSEPGKGSVFKVKLPLLAVAEAQQPADADDEDARRADTVELIAFSPSEPLRRQIVSLAGEMRMPCTVHEDLQALARYDAADGAPGKPSRYLFAVDVRLLASQADASRCHQCFASASLHRTILIGDTVAQFDASAWRHAVEVCRPLHIANWRTVASRARVKPAVGLERRLAPLLRSKRALVVDDNPLNQLVAGAMFARLGICSVSATSGLRALHLVREDPVDIVFMDLTMPGMDGMETTKAIRRIEAERNLPRVPVIALTGVTDPQMNELCRQADMQGFVAKPLTFSALDKVLQAHGFSLSTARRPVATS